MPRAAGGPGSRRRTRRSPGPSLRITRTGARQVARHDRTGTRSVAHLGCGTGAGTLALPGRFPEAEVTAVGSSAAHLRRLRERAAAAGVAGRLRVVHADLDAARWPDLGTADLVWASASLHHLADPGRTLRRIRELFSPDGLFVVVEPAGFPPVPARDAPRDAQGLEERCHAALARRHAEHVSHRGADWAAELTGAGFTIEDEHALTLAVGPSGSGAAGRYARGSMRSMRDGVGSAPAAADPAVLDRLLDDDSPHSVLRRDDLAVRTERTVWAARRT
ncbi:class I SAM-dependent methyltransferase [Streptomyces sp. NPDC003522]